MKCCSINLKVLAVALASLGTSSIFAQESVIRRGSEAPQVVAKRLKSAFSHRKSVHHEMLAPIQTELVLLDKPVAGQTVRLMFSVMPMEQGVKPDIRLDVPAALAVPGGKLQAFGTLKAKELLQVPFTARLGTKGQFEISAQCIAGEEGYRWGRRNTLYFTVESDGTVTVKNTKPIPATTGTDHLVQPVAKSQSGNGILDTFGPNIKPETTQMQSGPDEGTRPENDASTMALVEDSVSSAGRARVSGPMAARRVSSTVTGNIKYESSDGTRKGAYGCQVEVWDKDDFSADDFLAADVADNSGNFSITFDNASDGGLESGTADVYLKFRSKNASTGVVNTSNDEYVLLNSGGVLYNNVGGGTRDSGNWVIDQGTGNTNDSTERGFEVLDYTTEAWAFSAGSLGYSPHYTSVMWQVGVNSSAGSYYTRSLDQVTIEDTDISSPDVIMHEYGHSQHDSSFNDTDWPPGTGGSHSWSGHYTNGLAWTEGYGNYYCLAAQADHQFYDSYDPSNLIHIDADLNYDGNGTANGNSDGLGTTGYTTESAVCTFLLDLFDTRNSPTDDYDWSSFGPEEIWDVMRNYTTGGHRPYSIQEFFNGWHARGHAQTPKVNGQMQVHGMPQSYATYPVLGLYSGAWTHSVNWIFGGYGRGSFTAKNYSSRNYDLDSLYVWVRDQSNADVTGFGSDGNGAVIPAGGTRDIFKSNDDSGYGSATAAAGTWTITTGHYQQGGAWKVLEPAESGTDNKINVTVAYDSTVPNYQTITDDGDCVTSQTLPTSLDFEATADDTDSGIVGYYYSVGTSPGATNVKGWTWQPVTYQSTSWSQTITGLALVANTKYYINFSAYNLELKYKGIISTDGILAFDSTKPGTVTVVDDGTVTLSPSSLHFTASTSEANGCIWGYYTRVGTTPGAGDVQDWVWNFDPDNTSTDDTITGLTLVDGTTYYITVRYYNRSYLYTDGISNGIKKQAAPVVVNGRISLEAWGATLAGQKVTFEIRNTLSTVVLESHTVALDASGNYSFGTSITGVKDVTAKGKKYLRKKLNYNLATGTINGKNYGLLTGDCDNDNSVTILDYTIISNSYDKSEGDKYYDERADLDGDKYISIVDYSYFSDNYDKDGVP